ncbi:hypothetical protein L1856_06315 [Streptomyces sp. Tue 6430]|nr:hypothetical protein [Streptomyces sp. Tue 6430]
MNSSRPVCCSSVRIRAVTVGCESPGPGGLVVRLQAPAEGAPGRLSRTAKQDGGPEERLDVLHVRLVEDLPGGRVRVLTQETRIGAPAATLARQRTDPMPNGHQAWPDRLVRAASR